VGITEIFVKRNLTYSTLDVLMSSPDKPTPEFRQRHQLTRMWEGLRALEQDEHPKIDDWTVVADAVNMMETFVVMGVVEDADNAIQDAMEALKEAGKRFTAGNPLRLDGNGIQAIRGLLEDYRDVIAQIPERTLITAHRKTEKRLHEILDNKTQPHDVRFV
jgi:uncharacterized protein YyaL (SSP411 family)